ncbi:hypothetical protein [Croceimicrobium hydrocarbonivorans]|uniref:Uncharacterized protein n=1 Tax=Croceimicrobium hydrocarbonivorans TaxID=2761580 RepID=A0A7H0VDP2_9FLAO|nr:hypothetical protein [Croceimicrobium hydrocarbonivorans]QNR23840.1 hypothetical protein H4K34_15905 [Croceimicrobium hydrocarbonivorans]
MNMRTIGTTFLILSSLTSFGQFSEQNIETDSSYIEIIRNSEYHIYEETYKEKDSVWYSVHFIDDTTRLNTEGWKTKDDQALGVWREYNFKGDLLYTRDYDQASCIVNKDFYPYHDLVEQMKSKADSLIISTYSREFFNKHVRFDFNCNFYDDQGYVGTWIEPIERKPTKFVFRYSVKIGESNWYPEMIGIQLDSVGNYQPTRGYWNNSGFENVKSQNRTFQIDKVKAMEAAKEHGLMTTDPNKVTEYLNWEKFRKTEFYNGQFRYYIAELREEIKDLKENGRSSVVYKFNVYSFNPWTGEFVELKKMKNIHSWGESSGSWSGLIPDNN